MVESQRPSAFGSTDETVCAITARIVAANGLRFEVLECGAGERLAVCLHGFPEHAIAWRAQMPALASAGYRVWAVNQRGYGKSSRPASVQDYAIENLMADVAGLIDAARNEFHPNEVALIAHDWGALVAWCFASRQLRRIDALIILNVPHPACFRAALRHWRQLKKSWYIAFFQLPWLPELLLTASRGAAIPGMLRRSSMPQHFAVPDEAIEIYRDNITQPKAATAMLHWYRALARGGMRRQVESGFPKIATRTLVVWGADDVALDLSTLEGTKNYVDDLTMRILPGVSHWVQQDAPQAVNAMILAFLARCPVPEAAS